MFQEILCGNNRVLKNKNKKKKKKPAAPGVPKRSPIQVLSGPNVA